MRLLIVGLVLALAGCGVDGAPIRPAVNIGVGLDGKVKVKPSVSAKVGGVGVVVKP